MEQSGRAKSFLMASFRPPSPFRAGARAKGDVVAQYFALRRQKLAPCPDSYWFRVEDYLAAARAMREEARRATGPARAELIETAAQWEAIVCEHLDFLAELERVLR